MPGEVSTPMIAARGKRSTSKAVLLPGPQPRSTQRPACASGTRLNRSCEGRVRSSSNLRYCPGFQSATLPAPRNPAVHRPLPDRAASEPDGDHPDYHVVECFCPLHGGRGGTLGGGRQHGSRPGTQSRGPRGEFELYIGSGLTGCSRQADVRHAVRPDRAAPGTTMCPARHAVVDGTDDGHASSRQRFSSRWASRARRATS
jgi:hypothetical protein